MRFWWHWICCLSWCHFSKHNHNVLWVMALDGVPHCFTFNLRNSLSLKVISHFWQFYAWVQYTCFIIIFIFLWRLQPHITSRALFLCQHNNRHKQHFDNFSTFPECGQLTEQMLVLYISAGQGYAESFQHHFVRVRKRLKYLVLLPQPQLETLFQNICFWCHKDSYKMSRWSRKWPVWQLVGWFLPLQPFRHSYFFFPPQESQHRNADRTVHPKN